MPVKGLRSKATDFFSTGVLKEKEPRGPCTSEPGALQTLVLGRAGQHCWGICYAIMYQG